MQLGSLFRLAKGGVGPEEIRELLSALGLSIVFSDVKQASKKDAFTHAAKVAVPDRARVLSISGTDKDGSRIEGLLIMAPPVPAFVPPAKKQLDTVPL